MHGGGESDVQPVGHVSPEGKGRGGAYTNPTDLYEHGSCVLIKSIDAYECQNGDP